MNYETALDIHYDNIITKNLKITAVVMLILYTCIWIPVLENAGAVVTSYTTIFYLIKGEASNHDSEKNTKCNLWKEPRIFKVNEVCSINSQLPAEILKILLDLAVFTQQTNIGCKLLQLVN